MERKQGFSWRQGRGGVWFIIREVRSEESIEKWVTHYFISSYEKDLAFQHDVWTNTVNATRRAFHSTDKDILEKAFKLGKGASTAVTAMLINSQTLIVANVGDSRAVISKKGVAGQLSIEHEPNREREIIESEGGFVSNIPGDVLVLMDSLPLLGQWTDFLENIVSMAKQDLRIKKSATEVVFNVNNYVLDFYNMMLLDLKS
ncbi:hypothetical protein H5410_050797, partial [Solanum commersonii]